MPSRPAERSMIPSADLRGALKSPGRPRGHKAMSLDDVPTFLSAVAAYDGDPRTCLALRLVVLTFVRTTELRAAQWSEFEGLDGGEPLWRIPAERMKMKHEHIVPLAPQAVAVLRKLRELPGSGGSPVPVSVAVTRRLYVQQHDALCPVPHGLSRPRDGARLPGDWLPPRLTKWGSAPT